MSSVVKKTSHFTPKVKRRAVRGSAAPTPPATQTDSAVHPSPAQTQRLSLSDQTPPATQHTPPQHVQAPAQLPSPASKYTIATAAPVRKSADDDDVDPFEKLPQHVPELAIDEGDSDHDEYGENDIFKQPMPAEPGARRRSSVAGHRRLSGIGAIRRGSVSLTPGGSAAPEGEDTLRSPFLIGIPLGKPAKKRSLSTARSAKRSRGVSVAQEIPNEKDEQGEDEPGTRDGRTVQPPAATPHKDIVVGIDPYTGKLRKYRALADVVGYRDLPVAPENLVTTITSISQLPRKIAKQDEKFFAMVGVASEELTMSDLCKPTIQIGSISEKFDMAEEAKKKIAAKRDERRMARRMARNKRILYDEALFALQEKSETPKPAAEEEEPEPEFKDQPTNSFQLNIVGGKFHLNPESTVVTRGQLGGGGNREVEIENPFENPVTSSSYTKLAHTDAWTTEELVQLYNALSTWGTDFTFIAQLFPYRSRRQVKRKFILEEKRNPELVELALRRKLPPNIEAYCSSVSTSTTFKTVAEFNAEMEELRKDHDRHLEEINTERERAIKEDLEASRKREIEIRTGSKPMTKAEKIRELRKNETVVGSVDDIKRERGPR